MCKILIRGQAATVSKGNSPPRPGVAFVVGKWGPIVNTDVNARAVPGCSGGQAMPVVVYYSISWDMSQIQARHHHVAYQSQGHVCPLHTCTVVCLEGKGGRTLFCLPLPWVCCKTFSAQRNRPDSVFFLQTQVAAWGLRCRQPLASCPLPPREGSMLLLGYGHLRKVLQNVF